MRVAPVITAERGVPLLSVRMSLLVPNLLLSAGAGPVLFPRGGLDGAGVERLPLPLGAAQLTIPPEESGPELLEDAFPHSLLESAMGRRPRTILLGQGLPLVPVLRTWSTQSMTFLKGSGGLPLVPGPFSSPSKGTISVQKSSGIHLTVGNVFFVAEPLKDYPNVTDIRLPRSSGVFL